MGHNARGSMADVADVVRSIEAEDKVLNLSTFPFYATLAFRASATPRDTRPVPYLQKRHTVPAPLERRVLKLIPRARDPEGKPFPTECFEYKYDIHAHHHRLICGHDVLTKSSEGCGSNCMPSRTAESKVANRPFTCPHMGCKAKVKAMIPKRNATGQFIRASGRICALSHVYGLDRDKDMARKAEKTTEAGLRRGPNATRKRSESPQARSGAREVKVRTKHTSAAKSADAEAAALVQDPGVLELMRGMGPAHTRRLRGDQLETKTQIFDGVMTRAAGAKAAKSRGGLPSFKETQIFVNEFDAAEKFLGEDYPERLDDADLYCVCKTTVPDFLVLCERCDRGFHPGCIGQGRWTIADFAEYRVDRDASFRYDWEKIMENGHSGTFHCPDCQDAVAEALAIFEGGAYQRRAVAAEGEDLDDDTIEALLPTNDDLIIKEMQDAARSSGTKRKLEHMESDSDAEADGEDVKMREGTSTSKQDRSPGRPRKRVKETSPIRKGSRKGTGKGTRKSGRC